MKLQEVAQWMIWNNVPQDDGSFRKIPMNTKGEISGSTRTQDYVTYEEAVQAELKHGATGLAFCITDQDDIVGIDLDDCIKPDGEIREWAAPIFNKLNTLTYGEISPSGTGVKYWIRGKFPEGYRKQVKIKTESHPSAGAKSGIEIYPYGRFFAFTGDRCSTTEEVNFCQEALDWILDTYGFKPQEQKSQPEKTAVFPAGGFQTIGNLETRALDYVMNCEVHGEGFRNNQIFRVAGHLRAMTHEGRTLSDDQVLQLSLIFNQRFESP